MSKRIHLIATGGAIMHQLAIALKIDGNQVTGSDDKIADPAKSNLAKWDLLPEEGWNTEKITRDLDLVILGMHAKIDNPELLMAQELGIKVVSFPEYVAEKCKDKTRVVIGGSHGKTSTTAMVMHVLQYAGLEFDYLVGSKLDDFERMVSFSNAKIAVIEGDEYLTSPLDRKPKFHWYYPQIAVLTGISIDHVNVFPTEEIYEEQFRIFINQMGEKDSLYYFEEDSALQRLTKNSACKSVPYNCMPHLIENGKTYLLKANGEKVPLKVFGNHMLQNLNSAFLVCKELGVEEEVIYNALVTFGGTARRMEVVKESEMGLIMRDFAHSPSKLQATVDAVKLQYKERELVAFFELHTFSSVQKDFLPRYKNTMQAADVSYVFLDEKVFAQKGQKVPSKEEVASAFENVTVLLTEEEFKTAVANAGQENKTLLFMSSGTFSGMDFKEM